MAASSPPPPDDGNPLAMVLLRVWRESSPDGLRGRLIAPLLDDPTYAAGVVQLRGLVDRALLAVDSELADGGGVDADGGDGCDVDETRN